MNGVDWSLSAVNPQAVHIVRASLFKLAKDERFRADFERNERLYKQGVKEGVGGKNAAEAWFPLHCEVKPVALAVMAVPGGSAKDRLFSPNIAYVADPKHRGKNYGSVVAIHAALLALEKYEAYHMVAHVDNVQSIRVIIGTTGAMKAVYGKRLNSKVTFIRTGHAGRVPVLVMDVWLESSLKRDPGRS